jgi:hypothetical protein
MNSAQADDIRVTIENLSEDEGFFFTPFWIAAHNGSFDMFDRGSFSQPNWPDMTEIAENGNTGPLGEAFANSGAGMAGGRSMTVIADTVGPPPFNPGESATVDSNIGDASVSRYFNFTSMVIFSNDLFLGNDDAMAYEVFDVNGGFNGPIDILIFRRDVNDNGSEVNKAFGDAAFSTNNGQAMPEYNLIRAFLTADGDQEYLDSFLGSMTANGDFINSSFSAKGLIGWIRIEQVPVPGGLALLALGGAVAARRRRRD